MNHVKGRGRSTIAAGISLVFVVFLVAALSVVVSTSAPQAQAQNLTWGTKLDAETYITDIGIVDQDGNPVEGNIDHNLGGDSKGTAFHVKGEFPDDAKKDDFLEFESTIAVSYPSNKFDLTNSEGKVFATLYITGYDKRTNSQRYRVALAGDAENYVNKEFEFTSVIQGFYIPCTADDVKPDGTLNFFINGNRTGKGLWGQETEWHVDGQTCNTSTNPYPRGFDGKDPLPMMRCSAHEPQRPTLRTVELSDGRRLKNNLWLNQGVDFFVRAGGYETFGDVTITYDANGNNKTDKARQYFSKSKDQVNNGILLEEKGFTISDVPVRNEEFEAVEGGVLPGSRLNVSSTAVIDTVGFIPHNYLFPDKYLARDFKYLVTSKYGEDVWDNTNNAFAKLSNEDSTEIMHFAVNLWKSWVSGNLKVVEYDENRGYAKLVLKNASKLGALVTADEDNPLRGPKQLASGYEGFGVWLGAEAFGTYAPYKGSVEYSGPKVEYRADLQVPVDPKAKGIYAGSCTTDATGSMGTISGAAWGDEIIRPVDGTVRWKKEVLHVDGGAVMENADTSRMEWEIRRVDEPGHDPIVVKDRVPATRGDNSLRDINELKNVFEVTGLALGEYELRETKTPFGVREPAAPVRFSIAGDAAVHLDPVKNVWHPTRIVWEKVDAETRELLGPSRWVVARSDGKEFSVGDCTEAPCEGGKDSLFDSDPAPGKISVDVAPEFEYTVTENLPPSGGYELDSTPHKTGLVSESETKDLGEIENRHLVLQYVCIEKVDADTGEPIRGDIYFEFFKNGSSYGDQYAGNPSRLSCKYSPNTYNEMQMVKEIVFPEGYLEEDVRYAFRFEKNEKGSYDLVFYDPDTNEPLDKYPFEVTVDASDKYKPKYTFKIPNRKIPPVQVPFELPNAGEHPFLVLTLGLGIIGALSAAVALRRRDA